MKTANEILLEKRQEDPEKAQEATSLIMPKGGSVSDKKDLESKIHTLLINAQQQGIISAHLKMKINTSVRELLGVSGRYL